MSFLVLYAAIRLLSGVGSLALLNAIASHDTANAVSAIFITQTLVGSFSCFGLQFDAYQVAINRSKINYFPKITIKTHLLIYAAALIGSCVLQINNVAPIEIVFTEIITIFLGSSIFAIAAICGNYNIGLGNRGVATLILILPSVPLFAVSISQFFDLTDWMVLYSCVSIIILISYCRVLTKNKQISIEIFIGKNGRIGKVFAGFSQALINWLLMNNLSVHGNLGLSGYLLVQRIGDGISSLTMLTIQMKQVKEIINIMENKLSYNILAKFFECVAILVFIFGFVILALSLYSPGNTSPMQNVKIYSLEIAIAVSKMAVAIVSVLIMRFKLEKSTLFEISTPLLISLLLIISANEISNRQVALIIGYVILTAFGVYLLQGRYKNI